MNIKRITGAAVASAILFAPFIGETVSVSANSFYTNQTNAQRADITNWVANTPSQISSNISSQHINVNDLNGDTYVIQWGDTLSGISAATGISIAKLAYDNNISNVNLIYAGDTLILNRDGYVPTNWTYSGDGTQVASTSVTINNFTDNSDHSVNINVSPTENNSDDHSGSNNTKEFVSPKENGNATGNQSGDTNSSSDDTDSSTTAKSSSTLDDDEFSDAVSSKLADKLGLDDSSKLEVDFSSSSDDEDTNGDTDSDDSDTQTLYDSDQTITMSSDKMTTKNANKLAKKIYKQLKEDDKLSDINSADEIDLTITADGSDFSFNATLSTESSDDSSSSDSEDTESSDDQDQNSTSDEDSNSSVTINSDQNTDSTDSDY